MSLLLIEISLGSDINSVLQQIETSQAKMITDFLD
jgi:hypothetical protein